MKNHLWGYTKLLVPFLTKLINFFLLNVYRLTYLIFFLIKKGNTEKEINKFLLKKPIKTLIRNDRIGDSIITLPFLLGTTEKEKYFYISEYIDQIFKSLNFKSNWEPLKKCKHNDPLIGANLTGQCTSKIKEISRFKNNFLFTQLSFRNSISKGLPTLFSPNFQSNISQSRFIENAFNLLKIKTDPIDGIKNLNLICKESFNINKNNLYQKSILIFLGLGLDKGRRINYETLINIQNFCSKNNYKISIQEEPGFEDTYNELSKHINFELIPSKQISDLLKNFLYFKLVIGFDCGPMHLASLFTNTLTLFSHTSPNQWGFHIWLRKEKMYKFNYKNNNLYLQKTLNLGTNKKNWLLYKDKFRCAIHNDKRFQNIYSGQYCCDLNLINIKEILKNILYEI